MILRLLIAAVVVGFVYTTPSFSQRFGRFVSPTPIELTDASLNEVDATVHNELASIQELLNEKQWSEAVDGLIRLAETGQEKLILLQGNRYITLSQHCHRLVGQLPEEALTLYRRRVDPLAKKWFQEGVQQRDSAKLQRIVDDMFCSSWGDNALFALGELSLERGEYVAARSYWELISPLLRGPKGRPLWLAMRDIDLNEKWDSVKPILLNRTGPSGWIAYPDTDLSLTDVRVRLILASIRERAFDRAKVELAVFSKLHPTDRGRLGGAKCGFSQQAFQDAQRSKVLGGTRK